MIFDRVTPPASARSGGRAAAAVLLTALVALATGACSREEPPVGRLDVAPARIELGYPVYAPLRIELEMSRALTELEGQPLVFVHLLESPGTVLRTFDHPLPSPWQPGESLSYEIDLYQSALGPPLPPGSYDLSVGLYDAAGHRWPLKVQGEEVDRGEYVVASVEVPDEAAATPMFLFSSSWLSIEAGTDLQILGRRWLTGDGEIRLADLSAAGTVRLLLRIPPTDREGETLSMDEGADHPSVTVSSSCSQAEACVSGAGVHDVELPVSPGEDVGEEGSTSDCELRIRPNYRIVQIATLAEYSVSLENLAWEPTRVD